jgi:phasin family protein
MALAGQNRRRLDMPYGESPGAPKRSSNPDSDGAMQHFLLLFQLLFGAITDLVSEDLMNEMSAGFADPFRPWVKALTRINRLMVEQLEKAGTLRMESMKGYVELGVAQVKIALRVSDPHSLHDFTDSQFAVLSFVGHRILDDGRTANEWGVDCCNQAQRVARQNLLSLLFKY